MTSPLSQEQRAELVAKATSLPGGMTPSLWLYAAAAWLPYPEMHEIIEEKMMAASEAIDTLTEERDAALERVKALEAGAKPFIDAALQIPAEVEDFKVIAHVPGGPNAKAYLRVSELLTAGAFRQARAAFHPEPLGEGGGL